MRSTISRDVTTIAQISDLHFPFTSEPILAALRRSLFEASPAVLVVSGDLTQRARESQFLAAREYLGTLPRPQIVIPGNHDVPLYDVYRRFLRPRERFSRLICDELTPDYSDDTWFVVGADSTRAFTFDIFGFWKNGSLSDHQLDEIRACFARAKPEQLRVLAIHHPLINPWDTTSRYTVRRRHVILRVLEEVGVHVVLSGHLHVGYGAHAPLITPNGRKVLCVQSGTATSTRLRDEANAYNRLSWDGKELAVTLMRYDGEGFIAENTQQFKFV